jgi:tetratricopeptide (TPR) repeat protein
MLISNMVWGPTPADVVIATSRETDRQQLLLSREAAIADASTAVAVAFSGDFDEARRLLARSTVALQDLGDPIDVAANHWFSGWLKYVEDDLSAAAVELRKSNAALEAYGERSFQSTGAAWLAFVLARLGDIDEARRQAELARQLGAEEDYITQVLAHMADAQIALVEGDFDAADTSSRLALDVANTTDDITAQADALVLQAEVRHAAGRRDEADSSLQEALALYERKGNVVGAAKARRTIEAAGGNA